MSASRGESFYGGRFYENTFHHDSYADSGRPPGWRYQTAFRGTPDSLGGESSAYVSSVYHPDTYEEYSERDRDKNFDLDDIRTGQKQLFYPNRERHEVDMAFSTKDARQHVPTLLGLVAEHSLEKRGRLPRATPDLSRHSTRLVQRFADMGVIKSPADEGKNFPMNSLDWESGEFDAESQSDSTRYYGDEIGFDRVGKSRQFTRGLLRRNRPVQGEQLTIT
jgi:hypothetical protein